MPDLHDELLEQARHLANRERRRPKQASLRRAVSAAYYALFHALSAEVARPYRLRVRPSARRLLDHGKAKQAAAKVGKNGLGTLSGSPPCPGSLRQVADDFVVLQKDRHDADYNLGRTFNRAAVHFSIDRANLRTGVRHEDAGQAHAAPRCRSGEV